MLIRREQMMQLERDHVRRFHSDLAALLRREFGDRCQGRTDACLIEEVAPIIAWCQDIHGIREEGAITKFIYLSWLLGDRFEAVPEHTWIADILKQQRSGSERMEIVMAGVVHHLEKQTGSLRLAQEHIDEHSIAFA